MSMTGWTEAPLGDCVEILDRKRVPLNRSERETRIEGKEEADLIPYFGATGQVGFIDDFLFDEEIVLLGEDGAPFHDPSKRKAYIVRGKSWVNNHAHVLVAQDRVTTNSFLKHYLDHFDYHGYVTGTTRLKLNQGALKTIPVPLPPLPEQRRIVARIEELFSRLDAGVAALRHAKAQLQRYRQSVLAAAVTGQLTQAWRKQHPDTEPAEELLARTLEERCEQWSGKRKYKPPVEPTVEGLPELPSSWSWISPDQASAPEDYSLAIGPFGSNLKVADYTDTGVPLVFVRHIRANAYDLSPKFVSAEKSVELKAHSVDPGDILITKMGEPPGDAALYPDSRPHAVITADCIKLRLTESLDAKLFFVNAINSKLVAKQIAPRTRGVAQKKISLDRFRDVAFPLPPLAEQHQIVAEVEARTTAIDHLEAELDRQITRSNRLRQSTLAAAFSGSL